MTGPESRARRSHIAHQSAPVFIPLSCAHCWTYRSDTQRSRTSRGDLFAPVIPRIAHVRLRRVSLFPWPPFYILAEIKPSVFVCVSCGRGAVCGVCGVSGGCGLWLIVGILIKASEDPSGVIRSGLGAGKRQDRKRNTEKMKLEAGPVRTRSEEQLAFRTVPDMDLYASPYSRIVLPLAPHRGRSGEIA